MAVRRCSTICLCYCILTTDITFLACWLAYSILAASSYRTTLYGNWLGHMTPSWTIVRESKISREEMSGKKQILRAFYWRKKGTNGKCYTCNKKESYKLRYEVKRVSIFLTNSGRSATLSCIKIWNSEKHSITTTTTKVTFKLFRITCKS